MGHGAGIWAHLRAFTRALLIWASLGVFLSLIATAISFPWNTDPPEDESAAQPQAQYYQQAYGEIETPAPVSEEEQLYVRAAREAAVNQRVPETVRAFVERYHLQDKKILEAGAGSGLLQDVVPDYTGLDLSPTARRFFHKPFVAASATAMPFPDNQFDALWSVWVLEHIPNPQKALEEMRRVVKPGGYLLLYPTFEVSRYAAQGYPLRPYSDFDWKGKLWKATIPFTEFKAVHYLHYHQVRLLRSVTARLGRGPSRLHFIRLTPNYDHYWMADSDATTAVSFHELYLWFATRGDRCLNCPAEKDLVLHDRPEAYMVVQVQKR